MQIDLAPFRAVRQGSLAVRTLLTLPAGSTPLSSRVCLGVPAEVAVSLTGGARAVHVEIEAVLELRLPCDRCLEEVALRLPLAYAEQWRLRNGARRQDEAPAVDDGDVLRRDLVGDVVELDDGFWQNVTLELPAKTLCSEGCRGLCPRCGINRNRVSCTCRDAGSDPGLAALAAWRPGRR